MQFYERIKLVIFPFFQAERLLLGNNKNRYSVFSTLVLVTKWRIYVFAFNRIQERIMVNVKDYRFCTVIISSKHRFH